MSENQISFENMYLENVTSSQEHSYSLFASTFDLLIFSNLTVSNLQHYLYVFASAGEVRLTDNFVFVNVSTYGIQSLAPCEGSVYFDANIQSDVPSLYGPTLDEQEPFNCTVYVQGIPITLMYFDSVPESSNAPVAWIVAGCCAGLLVVSLILAGFLYYKKARTNYNTIQ